MPRPFCKGRPNFVGAGLLLQRSVKRESYSRRTFVGHATNGVDIPGPSPQTAAWAQVAELVDALVSGTSGASRGGSSPLLGTKSQFANVPSHSLAVELSKGF
jgi:hypothetical protein